MRHGLLSLFLGVLALVLVGCDRGPQAQQPAAQTVSPAQTGRLGLLDLDKVAQKMEWFEQLQRQVMVVEQQLRVSYDGLRHQMDTMLRDEQRQMGDKLTQEQQDRLGAMRLVAERKMQDAQTQMQAETARARQQVIMKYRELIRPVAVSIAQKHGVSLLMLPGENIFWNEAALDITDHVVEELKRTGVQLNLTLSETAASTPAPAPLPATTPVP
ncbi:MAG: OmpH family outer membrane protein [Phycisphaerales bacterium]|nr:OmpH family outer membrane protein [Phycisphaerales bacterium]